MVAIFLIEDDPSHVEEISLTLKEIDSEVQLTVATSLAEADQKLEEEFFDLIILDLAIPSEPGGRDAAEINGESAFAKARNVAKGTPILVLTGSSGANFIETLQAEARQIDIWGMGREVLLIRFLNKRDLNRLKEIIEPLMMAISGLKNVEVDKRGIPLSIKEDRLLRIFVHKRGGVRATISEFGGGLSAARVLGMQITNVKGAIILNAVVKLGPLIAVRDESFNYDRYIKTLPPGITPRHIESFVYGAKDLGANFYNLETEIRGTAFDALDRSKQVKCVEIRKIMEGTENWRRGVPETSMKIGDIRRGNLNDDILNDLKNVFPLEWCEEFEERAIQAKICPIHGDLHGENILLCGRKDAFIIDYNDIREGAPSFDPIFLELSLLFHPKSPLKNHEWPDKAQAENWGDLGKYLDGCPAPDFIEECRNWAEKVAGSQREKAASAYSILIRQLKYEDTNKEKVLNLMTGVKNFLAEAT